MTYQSTLPDTLIVNGVDLQSLAGVFLEDLGFLLAPATLRGQADPIPGRDGQKGASLPFDAYSFTVSCVVNCHTNTAGAEPATEAGQRGQFLTNVKTLAAAIIVPGGLVTLSRRLTNAAGTGYDTHTAAGQFMGGFTPTDTPTALRASFDLQFINLDGGWYTGSAWVRP